MRARADKPKQLEATFAALEKAAAEGRRCPENGTFGVGHVPDLARAGRIRIAVYSRNYRVVTILEGPHKGKRTAPFPGRGKPYKIIERETFLDIAPKGQIRKPSAPRILTAAELK